MENRGRGGGGWRGGRGPNPEYQGGGRGRGQQQHHDRGGYAPPAAGALHQQPAAQQQQDDAGWHQVQRPNRGRGREGRGQGQGQRDAGSGYNAPPGREWRGHGQGQRDAGSGYNAPPGREGRGQGQRDAGSGYNAPPGRGGHFGGGGGGRGYYGGRGGGPGAMATGGAGPSSQIVPRHQPDPALLAKFSKLKLIPAPEPDIPGRRLPIPRPDAGGKAGTRTITLSVNHFRLRFTCSYTIWHYDISKTAPSSSETLPISNAEMSLIKRHLFHDNALTLAFDGGHALFSPVELRETTAEVPIRGVTYRVRLQSGKPLDVGAEELVASREMLQALDVVMRQNSARNAIRLGKGLYFKDPALKIDAGVVALRGSQQSVKATENGPILCLDHSAMPFTTAISVIDLICNRFRLKLTELSTLPANLRYDVERLLKDFRVTVTHRVTKQKFKVFGLTEPAERITFVDDTTNTRRKLVDYYQEAYQKRVVYRKLPCLSLSDKKTNYVPMEFCVLAEWLIFPKEKLGAADKKLKSESVAGPELRYQRIRDLINREDGPTRGDILDKFHVEVHEEMVQTTARVLDRPQLKLCDAKHREFSFQISQPNAQWNLVNNKVLKGAQIDRWAVLDFIDNRSENNEGFISGLWKRCQDIGIHIPDRPLFHLCQPMNVLHDSGKLRTILQDCKDKASGSLQLLICPMADKHDGYKALKLISETEIGVTTQCCLASNQYKNKGLDQYFANLALKINAKLGGSNFELSERIPTIGSSNTRVMFIGADVNHPKSYDADSPSVVAVVASMNWPASTKYSPIVRTQQHRKENIIDIGKICSELVMRFAKINKGRPESIIYFRDGVSDSQFDMVLNEELKDIKNEFDSAGYKPKITVVVAQKRHQTRLFNLDPNGSVGNVPAGTVVDRGITAPSNFNFFLCSHTGILGTSKPTHYYVLWDEHGYSSDNMQKLIYSLCFTFARCTKPVSLVTPVYYADLLAYRGRLYYEGMDRKRHASLTLPGLHPNINKDGMFFL